MTPETVMVNSKKGTFSIPFFFALAHYIDVKPLDVLINEKNLAKYNGYS